MGEKATKPTEEYGITEDDMGQIEQFLQKKMHVRSVDDLVPSSE